MKLDREEAIRTCIEVWLRHQGISVEREVVCGNGVRADLVTPDMVIEVKKYLNRGALYQALGQGVAYQKLLKKPKLLIIGLAPLTDNKYQEAQRIAENIHSDAIQVVFLDRDPRWAQAVTLAASLPQPQPIPPQPKDPKPTQPLVKLPFEPVTVTAKADLSPTPASPATTAPTPLPTAPTNSPAPNRPSLTSKDVWTLLLLILLFLWIKAAFWKQNQVEVAPFPPETESISPAQN